MKELRENQMKSLAKISLGMLLGGAALVALASASFAAPNAPAEAELNAIQKVHAVATAENDRIKLNCVNDKLMQAKALVNIIESSETVDASKSSELHELRVAADNCVGKNNVNLDNNNSYTAPPGAAQPTEPVTGESGGLEPPLDASGSMPASARTRRR
ncbi:MAG TPA: hypothetical protein VGM90_04815 [Kofleriaceae bacterium]